VTRACLQLIVTAIALLTSSVLVAQARWDTLPPTPALPRATLTGIAQVNGSRLWYAEWNPAAAGVPVILLHGGYANSNYYAHLIRDLTQRGYRVIAMDSRGHGRSTRSADPFSYHLMAEDVIGLLDTLHVPRVNLVGWSDGGTVGYDLAIHHPDRIARLFAFGANADLTGVKADIDRTPTFAAYLKRVPTEYRRLSPTPGDWDAFDAAVGKMWATEPALTAEQLGTISVPTVLADGEHDEAIRPEHLRYLSATIPGARLVFLPGLSHFAMLQDPVAFDAAVLKFLTGADDHP
jgi:pimeloyl-ACP methyl ester carboxylesterase